MLTSRLGTLCRTGLLALSFSVLSIGASQAGVCVGNCGNSNAADGVVTTPPSGSLYSWISTNGGVGGAGQLSGIGGTNGTSYTTDVFAATAGQELEYYFNYITSDGSGFADYAWVQLLDNADNLVATLLTARTQPDGSIIPGFGLPAIDATLTPPSVPIIDAPAVWSALGSSSGLCFNGVGQGCGYTGWVLSNYVIASTGLYKLVFGVTNWSDQGWDSGLAFSGLTIDGKPIENEIPLPAAFPLFLAGVASLGLFRRRRKQIA
ncbi:MAG: NF038132 family protein [Pseudomonadota bacterium]|nr:NF038132 family protein [Pseudomonadota bacterium]